MKYRIAASAILSILLIAALLYLGRPQDEPFIDRRDPYTDAMSDAREAQEMIDELNAVESTDALLIERLESHRDAKLAEAERIRKPSP